MLLFLRWLYLPLSVDERLLAPSQAVPHQALGDHHPVDVLVVDADHQGQRVADLDVLRHEALAGLAVKDLHGGAWHGGRGCEGCGAQGAAKRKASTWGLRADCWPMKCKL